MSMHVAEEPERANVHLLQADFHEAAAGIDVVVGELLLHLADAQSVRHQLVGVDAHLVLAHRAPEVGNVHHVGNGLELLEQNPVFEGPQLHQVVPGIGASQRVPVDLARRAPVRADLRLKVLSGGRLTWVSRSRTFWRFQSFTELSSKIMITNDRPKMDSERR